MDIFRILEGLLLIIVGILALIFAEYQAKTIGRGGYVFTIYVSGGGFILIGFVEIVGGILN